MIRHLPILTWFVVALAITSCISQKQITYFQPMPPGSDTVRQAVTAPFLLKLKPGFIVSVGVSSISQEATAMANPYLIMQPAYVQNTQTNNLAPAVGYMVDEEGNVTLPLCGKVQVSELSTRQAAERISSALDQYLVNPTVNVRMLNYTVSVMGEVARPSVYTIPNEQITLPEVLSLAGDLTIFARRDNVMVVRDNGQKRVFAKVDLTRRDLFNSPYYHLQPNDLVYVEPAKGKKTTTDRAIQLAPTIISGLSLFTVILSILFK